MALLCDKTFNDYYSLHCLAYCYKDKNNQSKLIERIYIFLYDYIDLFSNNNINPYNYSLRCFLRYFSNESDNNQYNYLRKKTKGTGEYRINSSKYSGVQSMSSSLSRLDTQDFIHEIIIALSKLCFRYNSCRPSFHTYLYKTFHYVLLEDLKHECANSYTNSYIYDSSVDNRKCEYTESMFRVIDKDASYKLNLNRIAKTKPSLKYSNCFDNEFFDYNWIAGNYSNSEFSFLSSIEREMLMLNIIHGVTQEEMANKYCCCRNTIINKFKIIRNKLEEHFDRKSIYGQYRYNKKG